jgi:hypothetical protein
MFYEAFKIDERAADLEPEIIDHLNKIQPYLDDRHVVLGFEYGGTAALTGQEISRRMLSTLKVPTLDEVGYLQAWFLFPSSTSLHMMTSDVMKGAISLAEKRSEGVGQPLYLPNDPSYIKEAKINVVLFGDLSQEGIEASIQIAIYEDRLAGTGKGEIKIGLEILGIAEALMGRCFPFNDLLRILRSGGSVLDSMKLGGELRRIQSPSDS